MKILLVEDDEEKAKRITDALRDEIPLVDIELARSFHSGLRAVVENSELCDVLLLDMSMPNYDVTSDEPVGGTPENLAGQDLLAQMALRAIKVPTIVITMFDSFGKGSSKTSILQLEDRLAKAYPGNFRGLVYYNLSQEGWRGSLMKLIRKVVQLG